MPDFTFSDPAGQQISLAKLAGKPVLLNLWATWCAPCVTEMPLLDALAGKYAGKLSVVAVSQDIKGAKAVSPFFSEKGFAHLHPWLDPDSELAFHYGGANLPLTLAYDAQRREVWRIVGDFDWSGSEAQKLIEEATANSAI
jgi:thiol-disulfide isomerase/thioredoxin